MNLEQFKKDLEAFLAEVPNPQSMSVSMADLKAGFTAGYLAALGLNKKEKDFLEKDCGCDTSD